MISQDKRIALAGFAIMMFCGFSHNASAEFVDFYLNWSKGFGAKNSTEVALPTDSTFLLLGTFSNVPTNWDSINRDSLSNSFIELGRLDYLGSSATTTQQYLYQFDTTVVSTNALAQLPAYLVVISGASELGIYGWEKLGTPFYLPRADYPTDANAVATYFNRSNFDNMKAFRGTVSTNGIQTIAAAGVATPEAQVITFGAIPSKTVGDSFTLSATGGASGLPVTFQSLSSVATVTPEGMVTIIAPGTVEIMASQAGNARYAAATVTQTFQAYASTTLRLASTPAAPVLTNGVTSVTHTFVGNPNATYLIKCKSDLSVPAWNTNTVTVTTGTNGVFAATFTSSGDYVNAWKNRMFFQAKNL